MIFVDSALWYLTSEEQTVLLQKWKKENGIRKLSPKNNEYYEIKNLPNALSDLIDRLLVIGYIEKQIRSVKLSLDIALFLTPNLNGKRIPKYWIWRDRLEKEWREAVDSKFSYKEP